MLIIICILLAVNIHCCESGSYAEDNAVIYIRLQCHMESFANNRFGCRAVDLDVPSKRTFIKSIKITPTAQKSKPRSNTEVNTFYTFNTDIKFIPKRIGEHFPNLNVFVVTKTHLSFVEWRDFKNMKHLEVLKLNENKIERVSQCAFHYLENLRSINLDGNLIRVLHEKTFMNLPHLVDFSANDNNITHLGADTFRENQNLTTVLLRRNQLQVIEIDFHGWNVQTVDLKHNGCIDMKYTCCKFASFKTFTDHIRNNCGGPGSCK